MRTRLLTSSIVSYKYALQRQTQIPLQVWKDSSKLTVAPFGKKMPSWGTQMALWIHIQPKNARQQFAWACKRCNCSKEVKTLFTGSRSVQLFILEPGIPLTDAVRTNPPWLPMEDLAPNVVDNAWNAFACSSPVCRTYIEFSNLVAKPF